MTIEDDDVVEKVERIVIRLERTADLNSRIRFGISSGVIEVEDDNDGMCCNVYWSHIPVSFQMTFINIPVCSGWGGTGEDVLPILRSLN